MKKFSIAVVVLTFLSVLYGADTTETFDVGATDFEAYTSLSGMNGDEKTFSFEGVAGYGITENLSGSLSFGAESTDKLNDASNSFGLTLFSTLWDSDHFDFDLYLSMSSAIEVTPGVEINFDLAPDLSVAGLYSRIEHTLSGEKRERDGKDPEHKLLNSTAVTIGTYYTVTENLQLLLEYDMTFRHNSVEGEHDVEIGSLTFGTNYAVHDSAELIFDLGMDIPQDDEKTNFTAGIGVIFTLPN